METEKSNENFADLRQYTEKYRPQIEKYLREYLPVAPPKVEAAFNELIKSALFSGGKRLRPILTLLGAELFGGKAEDVLPSAVAVEFIYTSSKILDNLPLMNNVKSRTGKTAPAEDYGEGLAVLVALGLLNVSYSLVFVNYIGTPERALQAHQEIVECVGAAGIVGGQIFDLKSAESSSSDEFSQKNYNSALDENLKTSALMRLSLRVGAILAGADYLDLANLSRFAELLGDAFQLSGKLINSEKDGEVLTISRGEHSPQNQLNSLVDEAKRMLIENFPSNEARSCLIQLTECIAERIV